jgi:excisionase family DNA binding protein
MTTASYGREVFTPEQAADFLQVNRETIYRYIRDGRLIASKLGRNYRIPRRNLELLLWATRTPDNISLREYSDEEIEGFLRDDELSEEARAVVRHFEKSIKNRGDQD